MKNPLGIRGEEIAANYLKKKGYRIISRNFRLRNGEIDIIATHNNTLVFIEVKTRTSNKYGTPFEAITYFKLKALLRSAQIYQQTQKNLPQLLRIDAIAVKIGENDTIEAIEHIENISQ